MKFLTINQASKKYGLTKKYLYKYYSLLGGVQLGGKGSKIIFPERSIEGAILQQNKESMDRPGEDKNSEGREVIRDEKRSLEMGGRSKRGKIEDIHRVLPT